MFHIKVEELLIFHADQISFEDNVSPNCEKLINTIFQKGTTFSESRILHTDALYRTVLMGKRSFKVTGSYYEKVVLSRS